MRGLKNCLTKEKLLYLQQTNGGLNMDAKTINKQLKDLYDQWLNKDLANKYDIKEYTYPVLMKCNSEYCNSKTKILFIEKETKDWFSGNDGYKSTPKSRTLYNINTLMDWYDLFNENLSRKVSSSDYFEKIMVKTTKEVNSKFDCLWTSMLKIERSSQKFPTRKELYYCEDVNISILSREIEVTNPDVIVFVTASSNNNDLTLIKYVLGTDPLFIPIKGNNQVFLVTNQEINKLIVRMPNYSSQLNTMFQTISTLIKENTNANKYQIVKFQNSQVNKYQYF